MNVHQENVKYLLLSVVFTSWRTCDGGKVLIVPMEGSHWVNMDVFIRSLHSHGHAVTVMRTTKSWYIADNAPHYDAITVQASEGIDADFINPILRRLLHIERGGGSLTNFAGVQVEMFTAMFNIHRIVCATATNMFKDETLMERLKETKYDLVLTDPAWGAGILLARYLKLPLVYNVRWVTSGEGHLAISPSPLSFVPMTGSGLTDKMTFAQRVKNMMFHFLWEAQDRFLIRPQYQAVCDEFFGTDVDFYELLQGADLWLMRVEFAFEFPRPTMPNVVYIGGFQCKPAEPLPPHLEEFLQTSGDHGVVVMSLGTFVSELPADLTNEIAAAFAKLPQKVVWRHKGARPAALGNNTLLVDWMPQNDLLGHPKVKLFVAHGGTNGVQEAMYHGVPVVGLPLFFDQYDNLLRLKERGAARVLSLATVDKDDNFLEALQDVLRDPSYRSNMRRLSELHRDQPVKPLDLALFWVEFVMRHKGAAHLRTESYRMPWYSYHSVDVLLFSVAVPTLLLLTFAAIVRRVCSQTQRRAKG
ncbi:UDP-glucuronosyltransferase 2C1-like [Diretmus argenteus]